VRHADDDETDAGRNPGTLDDEAAMKGEPVKSDRSDFRRFVPCGFLRIERDRRPAGVHVGVLGVRQIAASSRLSCFDCHALLGVHSVATVLLAFLVGEWPLDFAPLA
jgi:hypothetical protein